MPSRRWVICDPLSLLCRLATSEPPPRLHTVRYAGVLAAGNQWRARITPRAPPAADDEPDQTWPALGYHRWAELLARTFAVDVLCCPGAPATVRVDTQSALALPTLSAGCLTCAGTPT